MGEESVGTKLGLEKELCVEKGIDEGVCKSILILLAGVDEEIGLSV
jgi:hypothetical protein